MILSRRWPLVAATGAVLVNAHTVITYPGWRGNNLGLNETFPYGMQWTYPCGGIPATTNRTNWPITGGGIAIQPGWYTGHSTALIYINIGIGTGGPDGGPANMSFPMVSPFEITGPTNNPYPGTFCLPQVLVPASLNIRVGDLATIQVIETTMEGSSLYNCADIIFALPEDTEPLNARNCFNSSTIGFRDPFAAASPITSSSNSSETCAPCPDCPLFNATTTSCPLFTATATSCPKSNGDSGAKEGLGVGFPLGVLALGILGL